MAPRFSHLCVTATSALVAGILLATVGCNTSSTTPAPPTPPPSSGAMFITDFTNNSVLVYGQSANCGSCNQARLIQGTNTRMFHPLGIAIDSNGTLYVANNGVNGNSITEYPVAGHGNIAPTFSITGLSSPIGVAVDASRNVYVTNSAANSIQIFAPGSNTPTCTIVGAATGLFTPGFITLDASGDIWVANETGNSIVEFPPLSSNPNGNIPPMTTIGGSKTGLNSSTPEGLAFDASGRLYVAVNYPSPSFDEVLIFAGIVSGTTNNIAPVNAICGSATGVNNDTGVAVNSVGTVFVVNSQVVVGQSGYITTFASNNLGTLNCQGPLPNATVAGPAMLNPAGIALH